MYVISFLKDRKPFKKKRGFDDVRQQFIIIQKGSESFIVVEN